MARLEIIVGRAGTGKTSALYDRVAAAGKAGGRCFVVVPEQATFETERRLSERLAGGLMGVTVGSWSTLARKLLDSLGVRSAFLSREGRLMLLRRSADACAKDLTVFRKSSVHNGFPAEMGDLISDFKRCGMSAEDVMSAAGAFEEGQPLHDKLHDVSVIYSDLERRCADRYIDPEDMMNELIARAGESAFAGAHIFIDGGDTMHEQAYPLLRELIGCAASVTAALTCDAYSRDSSLFSPEQNVLDRMRAIAESCGAEVKITRLEGRKRAGGTALKHLESELFAFPAHVFEGEPEGLSLLICPDRTEEVTEAAERIRQEAKAGVRYRDMAVIISDLSGYAPIVSRVFGSYGIPYFTDVKRSLATYPAAALIVSALRAAESGFEMSRIIDVMKTGYLPITADEGERFENLMLAKGLGGRRLSEPLTGDDAALEDVRRRVMEPITALRESIRRGVCSERTRAIFGFMEALDVVGQQEKLCERLRAEGRFREEEENAQVVNTIFAVLDQLYVIMGDEDIGLARFISVVSEGFSSHEIGIIPTTCDQVLVGSMDRTRSREVELLIVLGMNDGLFPKKRPDASVIDDSDLKLLKGRGFELWRSTLSLSESDLLTVYAALAKSKREIMFSYPVSIAGAGAMDAAAAPCRLVDSLRRIFPAIPQINCLEAGRPRTSEEAAMRSLGRSLRRMIDSGVPDEEAAELFARFRSEPKARKELEKITAECFGTADAKPLGRELAGKLYSGRLYGSASRLEKFNQCPFRHFAEYGMGAKERDERREKVTDLGSFYHEALETFVRYVMDSGLDWKELGDERVHAIVREIIPPIMSREGGYLLYDTARQRARLVNVLEKVRFTCCAVTRHIAAGSFRPMGCEVSFGKAESLFPPLRVEAGENVFYMSGVIDRIDSFTGSGGEKRRIIDYKSGDKKFDFAQLDAGLQLQLPLYAAAIEAADTVGMYYMHISDVEPGADEKGEPVKELTEKMMETFMLKGISLRDEEVILATEDFTEKSSVLDLKRTGKGELSGEGLVDSDEMSFVIETAKRRAAATLDRIFEGESSIHPTRKGDMIACNICPYGDVCRFDPDLSRNGYRDIRSIKSDEFFGRR
jgi:ATP-dependent helicase/nuclease subunit B